MLDEAQLLSASHEHGADVQHLDAHLCTDTLNCIDDDECTIA